MEMNPLLIALIVIGFIAECIWVVAWCNIYNDNFFKEDAKKGSMHVFWGYISGWFPLLFLLPFLTKHLKAGSKIIRERSEPYHTEIKQLQVSEARLLALPQVPTVVEEIELLRARVIEYEVARSKQYREQLPTSRTRKLRSLFQS